MCEKNFDYYYVFPRMAAHKSGLSAIMLGVLAPKGMGHMYCNIWWWWPLINPIQLN